MAEFFQDTKSIKIRDIEVKVQPLKVKHISNAAKAAAPLITAASNGNPIDVIQNADAVITLISLATGVEEKVIGEWNVAELTDVMTLVLEVNVDFFIQNALPKIQAMMKTVGEKVNEQTALGTQP